MCRHACRLDEWPGRRCRWAPYLYLYLYLCRREAFEAEVEAGDGGLWWLGVFLPSLLPFLLSCSLFRVEEGVGTQLEREV